MPGSGGKSSERLIEEVAAYTPVQPALFALSPIDAYKAEAALAPPFSGYTLAALPPADGIFNGFFRDSREHVELEYAREGAVTAPRDWHIAAADSGGVALQCLLTGATLAIRVLPAHIPAFIRDTFSARAIRARTPEGRVPPSPETCWTSFCRVVSDLLTVPPADRRAVPTLNPVASVRLELGVVLPFLGFELNAAGDAFDPPRSDAADNRRWRRRVLLEALLDLASFEQREPLLPALAAFLGVQALSDAHLSPREYGCLGCTSTFADEDILSRYELQVRNDAANTPWYLEALKQVAQASNSEALEMKVLELLSLGTQTLSSLEEAFAMLGLDVKSQAKLTDEQLIDLVAESAAPGPVLNAASSLRPSPIILRAAAAPNLTFENAFRVLGLDDPHTDDAVVCDRARRLWSSGPVGKLESRRALEVIGAERRSAKLLHLLEQYTPLTAAPPSLEQAYTQLGVGPDVGDRDIEAIFEANAEDASAPKLLELRRCLHTIADARNSADLRLYLSGGSSSSDDDDGSDNDNEGDALGLGFADAHGPRGPRLPVGLWNTGNTCYLNSLLQFYYSLEPVRSFVVQYNDSDVVQADDETMSKKKVGGRHVPFNEVKRSEIFVEHLATLFSEIQSTRSAHVTPSDLLAYLVLIPPQEDADEIIAANHERNSEEEAMLHSRLVAALQRQQDVTECIENVLYQMEAATCASGYDDDGEQHDLIKDLFYGTTTQTLRRVRDGGNRRTKRERFSSLLVDVSDGPADIYDSLDKFFAEDVLDLEDGPTLRTLRITTLPAILQVQVQRVQFDRETFMPYKSLNPLRFEETVYLDRYLEAPEGSELDIKVEEVKRWRAELLETNEQLKANSELLQERDALLTTIAWLDAAEPQLSRSSTGLDTSISDGSPEAEFVPLQRSISASTRAAVQDRYAQLCARLSSLETRKAELEHNIEHQFDAFTAHGYRIYALFIHKGDASYGHYWIYIRDLRTDQFYKYNDEFVSKASDEEVFDFREENLATPYFLVFISNDLLDRVHAAADNLVRLDGKPLHLDGSPVSLDDCPVPLDIPSGDLIGRPVPLGDESVPHDDQSAPRDGKSAPHDGQSVPLDGQSAPHDGQSVPLDGSPTHLEASLEEQAAKEAAEEAAL